MRFSFVSLVIYVTLLCPTAIRIKLNGLTITKEDTLESVCTKKKRVLDKTHAHLTIKPKQCMYKKYSITGGNILSKNIHIMARKATKKNVSPDQARVYYNNENVQCRKIQQNCPITGSQSGILVFV